MEYNPEKIEKKWRGVWEKKDAWKVDLKKAKRPYYNLMMFPYPSAEGLHVGNVYAFTGSDIHGRFRRMQGFDVFEPMGFDSFGIHSENFAIKKGVHPKIQTAKNIKHFTLQLKQLGALFAWDHAVTTSEPEYYKWTQWLFLQLYKAGLAYRAKAPVDWCPSCKTVLADEQVIDGKCERCSFVVIQKELEQWFFRITKYAERLLKNLDTIDWSERTKITQKNWIGKSDDTEVVFSVADSEENITVVTTRIDTIFGCTFMVLAPEHKLVNALRSRIQNWDEASRYRTEASRKSDFERGVAINKEKTGVQLKGIAAIHPVDGKKLPIYISDFVLAGYGTGAIMGVPGHDDRDFAFAKKFNLPIVNVIEMMGEEPTLRIHIYDNDASETAQRLRDLGKPMEYWTPTQRRYDISKDKIQMVENILREAGIGSVGQLQEIVAGHGFGLEVRPVSIDLGMVYAGDGPHVNSDFLNGLYMEKAIEKMIDWLNERNRGKRSVHYHLRDWLISRQRYWGPPIPIIYCAKCGTVPVPEKDLPVKLPFVKEYRPEGTGKSPLASVSSFVNTKCPQCKGPAERETDVSDTFLDSAWYFLRYPSSDYKKGPFDETITAKWLPPDMYIGGQEHAVLHLLYTRFITMALKDLGFIEFEEPFKKFRAHGLLTKDGAKMSKSKGNVVSPDEYFKKYGADTVRMYLMFIGPLGQAGDWSDKGIVGISRFLNRVCTLTQEMKKEKPRGEGLEAVRHRTIKKVTEDIQDLRYNTAIAALMEYSNAISGKSTEASVEDLEILLILLAPFAPYLAEELWNQLGHKDSIHNQPWPAYDPAMFKAETAHIILQVNGKVRDVIELPQGALKKEVQALALKNTKIQRWMVGKQAKRIIFVPGRLINIVI